MVEVAFDAVALNIWAVAQETKSAVGVAPTFSLLASIEKFLISIFELTESVGGIIPSGILSFSEQF